MNFSQEDRQDSDHEYYRVSQVEDSQEARQIAEAGSAVGTEVQQCVALFFLSLLNYLIYILKGVRGQKTLLI
jgi:hypothetical protein